MRRDTAGNDATSCSLYARSSNTRRRKSDIMSTWARQEDVLVDGGLKDALVNGVEKWFLKPTTTKQYSNIMTNDDLCDNITLNRSIDYKTGDTILYYGIKIYIRVYIIRSVTAIIVINLYGWWTRAREGNIIIVYISIQYPSGKRRRSSGSARQRPGAEVSACLLREKKK